MRRGRERDDEGHKRLVEALRASQGFYDVAILALAWVNGDGAIVVPVMTLSKN